MLFLPVRITKCTDLFLLSHVSWTEEEKEAVFKHVSFFVRQGRYPGKLDCENCILKANDALHRRGWLAIKTLLRIKLTRERGFLPLRITKFTDLFLLSHVSWTEEEKEAVFKHVSSFVRQGRYPGKLDCGELYFKSKWCIAS